MTPTIPRSEAIDRMKAGLPCQTRFVDRAGDWVKTQWGHFDVNERQEFRIPPEPRREAREYWIAHYPSQDTVWNVKPTQVESTHVREVLPDEVTLQMLGRDDARLELYKAIHAIEFGNKTDDKLILDELRKLGVWLIAARPDAPAGEKGT